MLLFNVVPWERLERSSSALWGRCLDSSDLQGVFCYVRAMILTPKPLPVGAVGFDTSMSLNAAQAQALVKAGLHFGVRYVPLSDQALSSGINKAELETLIQAGLAMMLVQFARPHNWSDAAGERDGAAAANYALALGYPPGACLWLDLANPGSSAAAIGYANSWYQGAVAAGMYGSALGVYCEPGVPLTSSQLYHELTVSRYWKTAGMCPDVQTRGYQFLQLYPGNRTMAPGIVIDYDVVQSDYLGSYPVAAVAG